MKEKIEKFLIDVAIKITREGKGCLFVIEEKKVDYDLLIEQDIKSFNILDNPRRLEALAILDGACIIDLKGNLIAYGVNITNIKSFKGFGTRHSAGYTASLLGNTSIVGSEEDKKVRIFREGKLVMEIDSLTRNIEHRTNEAVNIMESIGFGTLGTIGATALAPHLGITLIPGIIIFGSAHYLIKILLSKPHKKNKSKNQSLITAFFRD